MGIKRSKKKQQVNKLTSLGKWMEEPLPQRKWSEKRRYYCSQQDKDVESHDCLYPEGTLHIL